MNQKSVGLTFNFILRRPVGSRSVFWVFLFFDQFIKIGKHLT